VPRIAWGGTRWIGALFPFAFSLLPVRLLLPNFVRLADDGHSSDYVR
jgi:hypothetical protein